MIAVGDPLPDLPLATSGGNEVRVRSLVGGEAMVLVFLRHLG